MHMERIKNLKLEEWILLGVTAYVLYLAEHYKMSRFMMEASSELLLILNSKSFFLPVGRYVNQIPQAIPVLLAKLGFDMKVIANALNICEVLTWLFPVFLGLAVRKLHYAVIGLFCIFTMFGANFNSIGMEITYSIALILTWIWCFEHVRNKIIWLLLSFTLAFYMINCHPLTIVAFLFVVGFYLIFYSNPAIQRSRSFMALEILPVIGFLIYKIATLSEYDSNKLMGFSDASQSLTNPLINPIFDWIFIVVLLGLAILWIRRLAYTKLALLLLIVVSYYITISLLNRGYFINHYSRDFYSYMLPALMLIITAAGFEIYQLFGNPWFGKPTFLLLFVVVVIHGSYWFQIEQCIP